MLNHPGPFFRRTLMRYHKENNQVYVVIPQAEYDQLVANQLVETSVDTLSQADIEARLGRPVDYATWLDAYLMAESLQENLAGVIANFAHLTLAERRRPVSDAGRLEGYQARTDHFLRAKNELYRYSLREKQLLLLELLEEVTRQLAPPDPVFQLVDFDEPHQSRRLNPSLLQ